MPTYEYHCDSCDKNFDAVQSFHDDPLEACPTCGSPVRKVFGSVGIVFKGSGFYKTDSRKPVSAKSGDGAATDSAGSEGSAAEGDGSDKKESVGTGSAETSTSAPASSDKAPEAKKTPVPSPTGNGKSSRSKESAKS